MLDDKWPFDTEEEAAENAELRKRGYALLREAHDIAREALERRRKDRELRK